MGKKRRRRKEDEGESEEEEGGSGSESGSDTSHGETDSDSDSDYEESESGEGVVREEYCLRPRRATSQSKDPAGDEPGLIDVLISRIIEDMNSTPETGEERRKKRKFSSSSSSSNPKRRAVIYRDPLPFAVNCWNDLIRLLDNIQVNTSARYVDCEALGSLRQDLKKIDEMVGQKQVKHQIFERVLRWCQKRDLKDTSAFDHVVISGPAGVGKTTLAHRLASLFAKMGRVASDKVVWGTRQTMIAGFLGQTSKATQAVIDSAIPGILCIDEAYSMSDGRSADSGDSYTKAMIDTLTENLTKRGDEFMCIVIGYERELLRDFFCVNSGLSRRFQQWFKMEAYSPLELCEIFLRMCEKHPVVKVGAARRELEAFFLENKDKFPDHGGSVETLLKCCVRAHSLRMFGVADGKGSLSMKDIRAGMCSMTETSKSKLKEKERPPWGMYT